ncbi:MAG TPA: hypothetical protein VLB74_01810 [Flavobacterium sp.]|uniref:hypothetical protein n=1 Tax=Flavobacterium sp. TaxID=239 RepID=UPI002C155BBA|nr:hypothetical protein [Flavobacterium sp.]HSD13364.1 hypothetical protein [Flavobacterium sp.]
MKHYFTFLILLFSISGFSQSFVCGENQQEILDRFNIPGWQSLTQTTYDATTKYVFNVRFHVVYDDSAVTRTNSLGQEGLTIGENEVIDAIKNLNLNFNQFIFSLNIME